MQAYATDIRLSAKFTLSCKCGKITLVFQKDMRKQLGM